MDFNAKFLESPVEYIENSGTCIAELAHIDDWAERNHLRLNCAKTKEIIVRANGKRGQAAQLPPPCDGIERVSGLTALGVVINDQNDSC